jgi:hypothetical protein
MHQILVVALHMITTKKSNSIAIPSYLVYKWWILFSNVQGYCMAPNKIESWCGALMNGIGLGLGLTYFLIFWRYCLAPKKPKDYAIP